MTTLDHREVKVRDILVGKQSFSFIFIHSCHYWILETFLEAAVGIVPPFFAARKATFWDLDRLVARRSTHPRHHRPVPWLSWESIGGISRRSTTIAQSACIRTTYTNVCSFTRMDVQRSREIDADPKVIQVIKAGFFLQVGSIRCKLWCEFSCATCRLYV